jgi:pentatricopeptide repeat protein
MRDVRYERSPRRQADTDDEYNFWEEGITAASFNMDLQNLAMEDAQKAQDALEIMEELYQKHNDTQDCNYIKPNTPCYTTVINGWLESDQCDAAFRAQTLLDRMERMYDQTGDESIRPNAVTYMLVCQAYADRYSDDLTGESANMAEQILQRMKDRGIQPNVKVYTSVLVAWCKRSGRVRGAMDRAEKLLTEMESYASAARSETKESDDYVSRNSTGDEVKPNVITYTTFIGGLSRCMERNLATRAEAILERMERHGVQADMVAFTSVLNAWAKCKSRKEKERAASRAVALLKKMEDLYITDHVNTKPSLISYSTGINAIGNSLDPTAPEMAENVLRHMYDLHESNTISGIKPSTATFNAVITAMARSRLRRGRTTARHAESLLVEMFKRTRAGEKNVQPNAKSWGSVILAWAESGLPDAAENAQRVLDKMESLYEQGDSRVQPNVVCFTTVMRAWCSARRVVAAEEILRKMENQYQVTGDEEVRPNSISYVTMIDGFVKQDLPDAAQRSQETVDRMIKLYATGVGHIRPSRIVFNTLINAWSRSSEPGAAQRAEEILKWMETRSREGDDFVKPDEITFCGVLNAWANHAENGGAQRAQQILEHMESLTAQQRGFPQTVVCFNIVIKAWARSGDKNSIQYAERVLEQLESRTDVHADTTTYSSLINCCAYYNGGPEGRKEQALSVALGTFEKLCNTDGIGPNHVCYGTLFKAVNNLADMGEERDNLLRKLFRKCCDDGQVDGFVLSQVRNACSAELLQELVFEPIGVHGAKGEANVRTMLRKMPSRWERNRID